MKSALTPLMLLASAPSPSARAVSSAIKRARLPSTSASSVVIELARALSVVARTVSSVISR
ncbi:hypothetical protein BMJ28_14660, partial [Sinorhizobium medicae]